MKKLVLTTVIALFLGATISVAQNAVNFSVNDCNGVSHTLFEELDSNKVIVLCWVMPCGTCTAPALSAYTEVQNYNISHPNKVYYYLIDDFANTSCSTLTNWANSNGLDSPSAIFSNANIKMSDYGSSGMPKIVVVGNASHTVYFNQNNSLNIVNFNNAIIEAIGIQSAVPDITYNDFKVALFPNPVINGLSVLSYQLDNSTDVKVELYDAQGNKLSCLLDEPQASGKHDLVINTATFSRGIYFAKVKTNNSTQVIRYIKMD